MGPVQDGQYSRTPPGNVAYVARRTLKGGYDYRLTAVSLGADAADGNSCKNIALTSAFSDAPWVIYAHGVSKKARRDGGPVGPPHLGPGPGQENAGFGHQPPWP